MLDNADQSDDSGCESESEADPWELPELQDNSPAWQTLTRCEKVKRVLLGWLLKAILLVCLLYLFICSLDFLSSSFRLLGGKAAGEIFSSNQLLQNPVAGLMIGVLATVLVQSSSTSTSIVVTMVASGLLPVRPAVPIIMGANIGTSVTNTIVSLAQSTDRDEFRRAFAGATVHDMFNWLSVLVFLPLEVACGYLYHLTKLIVDSGDWTRFEGGNKDLLKTLTKPFTELIIQLDKSVITAIATGDEVHANQSLVKEWCSYSEEMVVSNVTEINNATMVTITMAKEVLVKVPLERCTFLFNNTGLSDLCVGLLLLVVSLFILCTCLVLMVKILNSVFRGKMATIIKTTLNADFPGRLSWLTGYIAVMIGAGMTILVQSSSVFTSAMTPLVGVGVIKLERMYPLTLGSNIGTTTTGVLAAMAASGDKLPFALQIALCHLFFNISGILLFYPVPCMRVPIKLARIMGNTTAEYRWFAIFYLVVMFFCVPGCVFALSMAGVVPLMVAVALFLTTLLFVTILNLLQRKCCEKLPKFLRTWDFLPFEFLHSLDPLDRVLTKLFSIFSRCCCTRRKNRKNQIVLLGKVEELEKLGCDELKVIPDGMESGFCTQRPSVESTPFNSNYNSMIGINA
ncbi:hypothetical protein CAPTEDRAFT_182218 [Capitella teleta]|uniref:Sodium-dependent phosphate transport protein 2B n=1 Tax=Capitella teleta TaxID=283909 RepID=R7U5F8_CAPTE|nr:hypothetical protein CAPTEDRAFT_182218 [Capitella teleta]|eukprot:ELU01605.1 hypothetical protein CAPTEDRAFT_182218 [Capitella teleta]